MQRLETTVVVFYIGLAVITRFMIEINPWSASNMKKSLMKEVVQ
jgi:hypothetical protein